MIRLPYPCYTDSNPELRPKEVSMSGIKIFEAAAFGQVRVVDVDAIRQEL